MSNLLRIVIVDDNLNDGELLISSIKGAGFAVRAERASDPEALADSLKKQAPDLVLCTLGLPDLSLQDVVDALREAGRHAPVIALSADDKDDVVEVMQAGASDLVRKGNNDHLKLVVTRTAQCQHQWRQLKTYETSLREAEKRCRTLLNTSRDAIAYVHEGMHIYANDSYLELFGYTDADEVEGTPIMDMVVSEDQGKLKEFLRHYEKSDDTAQHLEIKLHDTQDKPFEAVIEFSPATIDGEPCTQILIRNQADSKQLEAQLSYLSQRDLMTGLYNRQYFIEQLQKAVGAATQEGKHTTLLYLSIDKFNDIKGAVGVSGSDLVIADVGKVLDEVSGEDNLIARFEGETFAMLSPIHDKEQLEPFMSALVKAVADHVFEVEGKSVNSTISIGATTVDENTPEPNELLVRAERAYQDAVKTGGNKAVIYRPKEGEMTQKQLDDMWSERIREAVKDNRIKLLFQPVVSLHADPGERYEVLLRLIDKNGEIVAPGDFMPSAERTGMAKALDKWVLLNALKRLAERRRTHPDSVFFIKLTAGSLQDATMLPWISERLKELRMPAESLVFELKETTVVSHLKQAREFVKGLKELKCQFALDDFGTGLDPFQLIKQLPADYLKLDSGFMNELPNSRENQDAIKEITDTAHSMNKLVIVQQVADPNALSVLFGIGVNFIQGHFLQEPSEQLNYDFSAL